LDPTRFFCTRWYAWQNPDWSQKHENPYQHYLDVGRFEGRDPSALIDVQKYLQVTGGKIAPQNVYQHILNGFRAPAVGVYEELDDLVEIQRRFTKEIRLTIHKQSIARAPRPYLVVLQAGPGSIHKEWYDAENRNWDLLVNYYDTRGFEQGFGDYVFLQPGTKFTAMNKLLQISPETLLKYSYILFLDDDIRVTCGDLNRLFETVAHLGFDLAQMSLSDTSHCMWPALYRASSPDGFREVSAVEIMMPVMSNRALKHIGPSLGESVSGFGLDLLWGKTVKGIGGKIAVLDSVTAHHEQPIDTRGGAYYSFMRENMINPKAELWRLILKYDLEWDIIT